MTIKILTGDCRDHLSKIRDSSIHCVVTSPPYWGLRDYGGGLLIWGGIAECAHVWGDQQPPKRKRSENDIANSPKQQTQPAAAFVTNGGAFCVCGAWRGAFGLEPTYQLYVEHSVQIFREIRRILRPDGTLWLNLGDSYASGWPCSRRNQIGNGSLPNGKRDARPPRLSGLKEKDLIGIPWRVAFALQEDGWYLRQDNIWSKPNPMPESVTDRTTRAHEYMFHFSKSARYYYDADAVKEPIAESSKQRISQATFDQQNGGPKDYGPDSNRSMRKTVENFKENTNGLRNRRSVWHLATKPYKDAHFATFPPDLVTPCILAGCPPNGIVLDPFAGSGTVGQVAAQNNRHAILIEQNPKYVEMIERRCLTTPPPRTTLQLNL